MAEKVWHKNFIEYMEMIAGHPNYKGLPIGRKEDGSLKWIATAKSETGQGRKNWALKKAKELGIPNEPGVYAKVMLAVHPTKMKVCQVCGKSMSLYYIYPNASLVKQLEKEFKIPCSMITSIYDYANEAAKKHGEAKIKTFFVNKFGLPHSFFNASIKAILDECENQCRNGGSKLMGPGAMSNFPDRADGFHTYNRCCRSKEDTGRSPENLKTYTKDRRAYEYWSDGNIHAANQYMGSSYFAGESADHVGPISLGFVHDSLFLRKMPSGDNSAKRDRLLYDDIVSLIRIEKTDHVKAISWYSELIWEHIKQNYRNDEKLLERFRNALKLNMNNFMLALWIISKYGKQNGVDFLIKGYIEPKYEYFKYDYVFGENGRIIKKTIRNITDSTKKEIDRFKRIALESVDDYHDKDNRNIKTKFSGSDFKKLMQIVNLIPYKSINSIKELFRGFMEEQERDIVSRLKKGAI